MSGRAAILAMMAWLAPAGVRAERPRVAVEACTGGAIDPDALRERIALELATDPRGSGELPLEVRVRLECGDSGASVVVRGVHGERVQRVDLGEAEGMGRAWALALVVADLARKPPEAAPPRRALTDTSIGSGFRGRLYFSRLTVLAGLELALSHDWFRLSAIGMGTHLDASGLGSVGAGLWLIEVAVRPLSTIAGDVLLGLELALASGVAHGIGRAAGDGITAREVVELVVGGSLGLRARWAFDADAASELALSVGYDLLGAELAAGDEAIATLHGLRAELSLTFLVAP